MNTSSLIAAEFTLHADGGRVTVTLWWRDWADPHGPRRGSIARIRFDTAAIGVPMPDGTDSDHGGPLDQGWAADSKAELDAMLALLDLVMPRVQDHADNGVIPGAWVPDRNAGCSMCPCSPGLVGDARITIAGSVVDLYICQGRPRRTP